jgi:hypothetical protein
VSLREAEPGDAAGLAAARFALARALWDGHGDRRRAHSLAVAARATFESAHDVLNAKDVATWLASRDPEARR